MDTFAMTKKQQSDFESRFFDLLQDKIDSLEAYMQRMEKKLDTNTVLTKEVKSQAESTNGRVTRLEEEVFKKSGVRAKDLAPWYKDPAILRIITYLSLALLLIVGAAIKIDVEKFL